MRAALLLVLTGCSFFATEGPRPPPGPTACNREDKPVVTDVIAGIGAAVAAGIAGAEHASTSNVVVPIGIAGVFGASSVYGYVQVHRCRAEHVKRPGWSLAEMPAVM
jgi:hypothetical protein